MKALRARETFFYGRRKITRGQLVDAKDPVVKGRERFFEDPAQFDGPPVEQATAAPGEKRTVRKATAKK